MSRGYFTSLFDADTTRHKAALHYSTFFVPEMGRDRKPK